jgi:hypothetical protein
MKKRLAINLEPSEHADLKRKAYAAELNVSNYVRKALGLPILESHGKWRKATRRMVA